jgi:hypothetical protein
VFGIAQNPIGFPVVWRDRVRRPLVLNQFPYALYFTVDDDQVTVIALFPRQSRSAALAGAQLTDSLT